MLLIENFEIVDRFRTIRNAVTYLSLNMYVANAKSMVFTTYTRILAIIRHHLVELEILQGSSVNLYWEGKTLNKKRYIFITGICSFSGKVLQINIE